MVKSSLMKRVHDLCGKNLEKPEGEPLTDILERLWNELNKKAFPSMEPPYPVTHGKKHAEKVVENICEFLEHRDVPKNFSVFIPELFIAAMIHDVGMRPAAFETIEKLDYHRDRHARIEVIEKNLEDILTFKQITGDQRTRILLIASTHTGCSSGRSEDDNGGDYTSGYKLNHAKKFSDNQECEQVYFFSHILCCADFFDIGQHRFVDQATQIGWTERQKKHRRKHELFTGKVDGKNKEFRIDLAIVKHGERQMTVEDIRLQLEVQKKATEKYKSSEHIVFNQGWKLSIPKNDSIVEAYPLVGNLDLFSDEYNKAKDLWAQSADVESLRSPLQVDLMGHSLYGRFVKNLDEINDSLKELLRKGKLHLRILILDPADESRQMLEVLDAQSKESAGPDEMPRAIFPSHDDNRLLSISFPLENSKGGLSSEEAARLGDILSSLRELECEWKKTVQGESKLEVRVTRRILYSSINRFGDRMIVSPYKSGGLSSESTAFILSGKSPLFVSYLQEFDEIWESVKHTRLWMYCSGDDHHISKNNPASRHIADSASQMTKLPALAYEAFILNQKVRIKKFFLSKAGKNLKIPPPPLEVEFQPSANCSFSCEHCIGRHLHGREIQEHAADALSVSNWQSIFEYENEGMHIQRVRISGLSGDPFDSGAKPFTLELIGHLDRLNNNGGPKREVVVFTNGVALNQSDIQSSLEKVDYVHVSLDAAKPETFRRLKGSDNFEEIVQGVRNLANRAPHPTKVGLGFVITQTNINDIRDFLQLALECKVQFVRFKPDIRGSHGVSSRSLKDARHLVAQNTGRNGLDVYMTDVSGDQCVSSMLPEICWGQFLCVTIGSDGLVYRCDHLSGSGGDSVLGDLKSRPFSDIWEDSAKTDNIGKICRRCRICPPFNARTNIFLREMEVLYRHYGDNAFRGFKNQVMPARCLTD